MRKDIFVTKYEQLDIMGDYKNYFTKIEELKLYVVKFEENDIIKPKIYLFNSTIGGNKWWLIIIITYDERTFFANNKVPRI